MVKLDNGRKFLLVFIGITAVCFMFMGQPQPSSAPVVPITPPAVAATTPASAAATPTPIVAPSPTATTSSTPFTKFVVYEDNINNSHYVLSGLMPSGNCIKTNDFWTENCKVGQRCLQITYDTACSSQEQGWAGAYWLEPANNWGDLKGGYNLTGAQKLVFWARGAQGGEIIDSFKIGGITGHKFQDSDTASIGPVTLTKEWQQYSIDLTGKDLSYIGGGFAWVANTQSNAQPITFYLDDIYYE